MSDNSNSMKVRRKFLKLLGGSVVLIPLTALQGCSGKKESTPAASTPKADPAPPAKPQTAAAAKPAPVSEAQSAPDMKSNALPHLEENNPQAEALGYKHDASQVDGSKYPRFEASQLCKNCALYQSKDGAEWAACALFPGKAVNANGWCSAYAPLG